MSPGVKIAAFAVAVAAAVAGGAAAGAAVGPEPDEAPPTMEHGEHP